jgi:RimJ/RimL family protein N-acetyltransferase
MKRLMLEHAFQSVESVIFLVASSNARSRKAMEKVGARLTGRVETRNIQGAFIDHVVYEIRRERALR